MEQVKLKDIDLNGNEKRTIDPEIGLSEKHRLEITQKLNPLLADTYSLLLLTQQCHWNVKGSNFMQIHNMTEEQYNELFEAIDGIAERIRMLDFLPASTLSELYSLASIEEPETVLSTNEMIELLIKGHRQLINDCRTGIETAAKYDDEGTVDLFTERLRYHEKTNWMLKSHLEK